MTNSSTHKLPCRSWVESQSNPSSIDAADADIVLNLATDFANTVIEMLGNVRSKYPAFKNRNLVPSILNEVRKLSGGVMGMAGKLESVLPVCDFLCHKTARLMINDCIASPNLKAWRKVYNSKWD